MRRLKAQDSCPCSPVHILIKSCNLPNLLLLDAYLDSFLILVSLHQNCPPVLDMSCGSPKSHLLVLATFSLLRRYLDITYSYSFLLPRLGHFLLHSVHMQRRSLSINREARRYSSCSVFATAHPGLQLQKAEMP